MVLTGSLVVPTSMIVECIDVAEYTNLTEQNKDFVRIILSCGTIDMQVNSLLRTYLLNIFPSGVTHDALVGRWEVS